VKAFQVYDLIFVDEFSDRDRGWWKASQGYGRVKYRTGFGRLWQA